MTTERLADEPLIAVFVDYENLAIGVRRMRKGSFQIDLVLRRLLEKGRIVYKRAYCDWGNYRDAVREFHTQGVELIDIPQSKASGKNSADIHMVVDALDLCHQKEPHRRVRADLRRQRLLPAGREAQGEPEVGDRLRRQELHFGSPDRQLRRVHLLRRPDPRGRAEEAEAGRARARSPIRRARTEDLGEKLLEAVRSLERDYDTVWGSMLKQTIRRLYPGFNEGYYGAGSFAEILEMGEKEGLIELEYDESRGNYIVRSKRAA